MLDLLNEDNPFTAVAVAAAVQANKDKPKLPQLNEDSINKNCDPAKSISIYVVEQQQPSFSIAQGGSSAFLKQRRQTHNCTPQEMQQFQQNQSYNNS